MKFVILVAIVLVVILLVNRGAIFKVNGLNMRNQAHPTDALMTGGQPSLADLAVLKTRGITTVINLRGLGESLGFDETAALKDLGIKYVQIPMSSAKDLTKENALKLDKALKNIKGTALVHCASSNRVGALLALREFQINGKSAEDAIAFGTKSGMTGLASDVKKLLVK